MNVRTSSVLYLDLETGPSESMNGLRTMTHDICMTILIGFGQSSSKVGTPMSPQQAKIVLEFSARDLDRQITNTVLQMWLRERSQCCLLDLQRGAGVSGSVENLSDGTNTSPYTDITPVTPQMNRYV